MIQCPHHNLTIAGCVQGLFQYLDIIVFVEATIYQMDEENEQLCLTGQQGADHVLAGTCQLSSPALCDEKPCC